MPNKFSPNCLIPCAWPSQEKNWPSGVSGFALMVAPSTFKPTLNRERTASTVSSVRWVQSCAKRSAETVAAPF